MPTYDYLCDTCMNEFEITCPMSAHMTRVRCHKCGADAVQTSKESQGGPGNDPVTQASNTAKRGGVSMADNSQPMAQARVGGQAPGGSQPGGATMRGKSPQRENGGAPAKAGVPATKQNG